MAQTIQADELDRMGPPQVVFKHRMVDLAFSLFVAAVFLGLGILALLLGLFLWPAAKDAWNEAILCFLLGAGMVGGGGYFGVRKLRKSRTSFLVFEAGLVYKEPSRARLFRWNEIDTLSSRVTRIELRGTAAGMHFLEVPAGSKVCWSLRDRLEDEIHVDVEVARATELISLIEDRTLPLLLDRARKLLRHAESVSFGPVSVGRTGLTSGNVTLAWEDFDSIRVQEAVLEVEQDGTWKDWLDVDGVELQNHHVLMALVREQKAGKR